jgi:hypothetical protein
MAKYDLEKHSRGLFPWFWQNVTNLSLIDVLMEGLFGTVNTSYGDLEIDYTQKVGYTIQRLSLETSLNDRFDNVSRRITVQNGQSVTEGFVFNESETINESQEKYVFNKTESLPSGADEAYFLNEGESGGSSIEPFLVFAPLDISDQEEEITSWIDRVKITGTEYIITFL